ncbi:MAG: Ig-like domain-containing protein [Oscillospiraceae bacterium]|jgi:hypothetical protein|nr:Ig-like domain-containing protein [Oscillospiraceae bacterium]
MKKSKILALALCLALVLSIVPLTSLAVTTAEPPAGTGALEGWPSVDQLPLTTTLPNPFEFFNIANDPNGNGVVDNPTTEWAARRAEIKELLQRYWLGNIIKTPYEATKGALSGNNLSITITDTVYSDGTPRSFTATVAMPTSAQRIAAWGNDTDPVPFIIVSGSGGLPSQVTQGYALVTIPNTSIYSDSSGVTYSRTGLYVQLYPYNKNNYTYASGAFGAWAWAVQRLFDALEQKPSNAATDDDRTLGQIKGLDITRTAVTGHSRYGKAALFAGAFEDRIAVFLPSESGGSGLQGHRYLAEGKIFSFNITDPVYTAADRVMGKAENASVSWGDGNSWFPDTAGLFLGQDGKFPFDSSDVVALAAPKPFYSVTGIDLHWMGTEGGSMPLVAALEVYDYVGTTEQEKNNIAIRARRSSHAWYNRDTAFALAIMDREWQPLRQVAFEAIDADHVGQLNVQDSYPTNNSLPNGSTYPAKPNGWDNISDFINYPFDLSSSYMPWTSPNKYLLWTAQDSFLVGYAQVITAHTDASAVVLVLPDGTLIPEASRVGEIVSFNITAEQSVYGRYELRTVGEDKINRSVYFSSMSLNDALRHGATKGDEGEDNRVVGFASRLANDQADPPKVYVTGDGWQEVSFAGVRQMAGNTVGLPGVGKMDYGLWFHDSLFYRIASKTGADAWALDNNHTFTIANLKFATIPGFVFQYTFGTITAQTGSSSRPGSGGATNFTRAPSWNAQQYNNGQAGPDWPMIPDVYSERTSGKEHRATGPANWKKTSNFNAEITFGDLTYDQSAETYALDIYFSEAMNKGELGVGFDVAGAWETAWAADGQTVTLTIAAADYTAADIANLIVFHLVDNGASNYAATNLMQGALYQNLFDKTPLLAPLADGATTAAGVTDRTVYADGTLAAFEAALLAAQTVYAQGAPLQADIDATAAALKEAIDNLVKKGTVAPTLATPDKVTIKKGRTVKVEIDFNGDAKYLAYTSGNAAVATVAGTGTTNLTVTGVKVGNAPITVRATDGSGLVKVFLAIVTA